MAANETTDHPTPLELFQFIEKTLTKGRRDQLETHFSSCDTCAEMLAATVRSERPASREEEAELARLPSRSQAEHLAKLEPHLAASQPAPGSQRGVTLRPILVTAAIFVLLVAAGLFVQRQVMYPAMSRRAGTEALAALVELRQGAGRIPLRYIEGFERAGITRSSFDTTETEELALRDRLRETVQRSPQPAAVLALGLLLLDGGELQEAETYLEQVRSEPAQAADAINALAVVAYERAAAEPDRAYEYHQRGLALLRQAESADPENLMVIYNFGVFYEALGMVAPAVGAYERYLEHDPSSQWAEEAAFRIRQLNPGGR